MAKGSFKTDTAELFMSAAEEEKKATKKKAPSKEKQPELEIPANYKLVKVPKSERMQLLVRPLIKDAIKQEAAAQGLSMNDLVNNIFEEYLERQGKV